MFLHADIIDATASHKDGDTIYFTDSTESIEITVDIGCTSHGVIFNWSKPENTNSSSKQCPGNPYFSASESIYRKDKPTRDDEGTVSVNITHPKLKSRNFTWNLKCKYIGLK